MSVSEANKSLFAWIFPPSATPDARRLLVARTLRGFADGLVSVLLAGYLTALGFSAIQAGILVTGTLLGSAALTLAAGLLGLGLSRRRLLLGACLLMAATGIGFAVFETFLPLLLVAVIGTLNPSSGDVSVFLPTEQSMLPDTVVASERTALFARYNIGGNVAGAVGALVSGVPVLLAERAHTDPVLLQKAGFLLYAGIAVGVAFIYWSLSPEVGHRAISASNVVLGRSRRIVVKLAALFSIDSLGTGFVVQSLLALWLFLRFDLPVPTVGAIFFVSNLLSGLSQLASPWLARRVGLVRTMAYTHLPANVFLILAALMPNAPLAVTFLLLRMALSQMDVPARQSYVMAVVPPDERAAAASITNVPRSLATASTPFLAGALLTLTTFGWPLIIGGAVKVVYDLLLLAQFRSVPPPEER